MDLTILIALAALGLGIANTAAQIAAYRRERTSVAVVGGSGWLVYPVIDSNTNDAAWITATNTGRHPVTIQCMYFVTDRGAQIAIMDPRFGERAWVLQPGEQRTASVALTDLILSSGSGAHLTRAVAEGPSGQHYTGPVQGVLAPVQRRRRLLPRRPR